MEETGESPAKKRKVSHRGAKAKGSDYERQVSAWLNANIPGLETRRALLSGGGRNTGDADIEGSPGVHLELKRTETFSPKAAMAQAETAISKAKIKTMPVVVNRTNGMKTEDSYVVMRLEHWSKMYQAWLRA